MKINVKLLLTISSCIGVFGVVASTAYGQTRASHILKKNNYMPSEDIKTDLLEKAKLCWTAYIPAAVISGLTIGAIITNHKITKAEIAGISTSALISSTLLNKYKLAIEQRYGKDGLDEITKDVAHMAEYDRLPIANSVISFNSGFQYLEDINDEPNTLFYDEWSDTWFISSLLNVKNAMYHFNRNFHMTGENSLRNFYELLGINTEISNEKLNYYGYGNNILDDCIFWIDFNITPSTIRDTDEEYYIISFVWQPGIYDENEGTYISDIS